MRVLLASSTGGHLGQLEALRPWWTEHERHWITFDKPDARSMLAGEAISWAHHPTTRNIPNLIRNFGVAWKALRSVPARGGRLDRGRGRGAGLLPGAADGHPHRLRRGL